MGRTLYRGYDREGLDREYNLRAKAGDRLPGYFQEYATRSLLLRANRPARLNRSYGPRGANTLDIFPPDGTGPAPVHVFIHGGYWKSLDAKDFSFVAGAFAPKGVLTVVVDYTLVPHATIAEQAEECRWALEWVWRHAREIGGDPGRIHLGGHSAGAHLVSMLLATDWAARGLPADLIRSAMGISGVYDLEPIRHAFVNDDLRLTAGDAEALSAPRLAPHVACPVHISVGAEEGDEMLRQSADLAKAWQGLGPDIRSEVLDGHDHFSIVLELATPEGSLARTAHALMGLGG